MTTDIFTMDDAEFARHEAARLRDPNQRFPAFEGKWAEALAANLRQKFDQEMALHQGLLNQVLACFEQAQTEQQRQLIWVALSRSWTNPGIQTDEDGTWLMALTAFACLLTIDRAQWTSLDPNKLGNTGAAKGVLAPTDNLFLAAAAFCRLTTGMRFEGVFRDGTVGWVEVDPSLNPRADLAAAIINAILAELDQQKKGPPTYAASPDQAYATLIAEYRAKVLDAEWDNIAMGIGIRRPNDLSDVLWKAVIEALAEKLQIHVIGLAEKGDAMGENLLKTRRNGDMHLLANYMEKAQLHRQRVASQPIDRTTASSAHAKPSAPLRETKPVGEAYEFDFFLSHASEDKLSVVDDLYAMLTARGWRVWYDKVQMDIGSNLVKEIEKGLKKSRFAVLIISPVAVNKPGWVEAEWEAVLGREINSPQSRILPVLHELSFEAFQTERPLLARLISASTKDGIAVLAGKLERTASKAATQ